MLGRVQGAVAGFLAPALSPRGAAAVDAVHALAQSPGSPAVRDAVVVALAELIAPWLPPPSDTIPDITDPRVLRRVRLQVLDGPAAAAAMPPGTLGQFVAPQTLQVRSFEDLYAELETRLPGLVSLALRGGVLAGAVNGDRVVTVVLAHELVHYWQQLVRDRLKAAVAPGPNRPQALMCLREAHATQVTTRAAAANGLGLEDRAGRALLRVIMGSGDGTLGPGMAPLACYLSMPKEGVDAWLEAAVEDPVGGPRSPPLVFTVVHADGKVRVVEVPVASGGARGKWRWRWWRRS
jgi:hypothetical protein